MLLPPLLWADTSLVVGLVIGFGLIITSSVIIITESIILYSINKTIRECAENRREIAKTEDFDRDEKLVILHDYYTYTMFDSLISRDISKAGINKALHMMFFGGCFLLYNLWTLLLIAGYSLGYIIYKIYKHKREKGKCHITVCNITEL